ncbi:imidazole glycerol phosphate synthase subunit HisH [Luminiphilus sp.]|nr:imidazole glycerol phosphate synthase subunit HisH [Luminiphilus sp.]
MIGIIDYGAGNISSVMHALERVGEDAESFSDPSYAFGYDRLILPGVGSFRAAMEQLNDLGWPEAIRAHVKSCKPLLGICLGMQLLFDQGDEDGPSSGLGLISGRVVALKSKAPHRIPHVGWNSLQSNQTHPIMAGVKDHIDFYFVHSYRCVPTADEDVLASCEHGGKFVASVAKGSVVGMQFHPEKSQPAGLKILQNFAEWNGKC